MRSIHLFQFIQLDDVEPVKAKTASDTEACTIALLETDQLRCGGSSNIQRIGYRARQATLEIHFHSGSRYRYLDVPPFVFDDMVTADSVGKYYHRFIKGYFNCQKL